MPKEAMETPRQRCKTSSEMEVSPVTGLAENLGGLRTDSNENTPFRRSKWPFNAPDALPSPKWPLFRRPSPDPSPTVVYGLLHDIGNTAAGSGFAEKPPKFLHNRKTLFNCSPGANEGSFDKENLPGSTEGPTSSSPYSPPKAKPSIPLISQPSRQNSEDSGCPIELHTDNRYALDAFGYVFDSFGDLRQSKASCASSDEGIRRLDGSSMSSKDDSMSQKTSWESGLPAASSARSSFLATGDSEDGFPTTLEEFFQGQDVESHMPPRYNDLLSAPLYSAPLSASVPKKSVGTPSFHVYSEGSPENSKEQIRRRLMLGSEDETVSSPPRRLNCPPVTKLGTPSTPLGSLESVLNCNVSIKNPFKRPVSPGEGCSSSLLVKRPKSDSFQRVMSCSEPSCTTKVITLQRCHSENEASIKLALQKSEQQPDLIGDFSKPYALPLMKGKHDDLKMISPVTLAEVLEGKYNHSVKEYAVIDCRYPYEYEGGHISGAVNIYTREDLMSCLLPEKMTNQEQKVLVFHCEFSSERGPKMSRFLRNMDRQMHNEMYPKLKYPEIYVLEGGYKAFFEGFKSFCVPEMYVPMRHKDHETELKEFRARSKSGGSLKGRGLCARSSKKF
ncbi:M-phase inducer phosphatase-like isoform X2 [Ornithodoros turicata]|uniref:M-phase inducer phosphatase-like isoform X2 n=1 Tax=Ornithodoros turicata TaxID=34597 RepID=UPI003139C23B